MTLFRDGDRIDFWHDPPPDVREWAGAEGWYPLEDADEGTQVSISLTLSLDLPLARFAAPTVAQVMRSAMAVTGARFATSLEQHLGVH